MTTPIGQLSYANGSTDTFQVMIDRINLIANAISNAVVTVDTSSVGSTSVGNAAINGTLSAQTVATNSLRGGNVQTSAVLPITSNVSIGNSSSNVVISSSSVTINTSLGNSVFTSTGYAIGNLVVSTSAVQVGNSSYYGQVNYGGLFTTSPSGSTTVAPAYVSVSPNTFINSTGYYAGNTQIIATGVIVGGNASINSTALSVGNSTINAVINSSSISVGGHSINASSLAFGNSTVNASSVAVGNSIMNTSIIQTGLLVGSNISINSTSVFVGNSTVNAYHTAFGFVAGTSNVFSGVISVGSSTTNSYMVQTGFATGNNTVNSVLTSTYLTIGSNTTLGSYYLNTGQATFSQANPVIVLNKTSGNGFSSYIEGQSNGLNRWIMALGEGSSESGANTGSNFAIYNYGDNGSYINMPFFINRATSQVTLAQRPTWAGTTPYDTGNLNSAQLNAIAGGTIYTTANYNASNYALLSGANFAALTYNGNHVWNRGDFNISDYALLSGANFASLTYNGYHVWNRADFDINSYALLASANFSYLAHNGYYVWSIGDFNINSYALLASANFSYLAHNGYYVWSVGDFNINNYATLAGCTFTAEVDIASYSPAFNMIKSGGGAQSTQMASFTVVGGVNKPRWNLVTSTGDVETGSNNGSNFAIYRYDDSGNYIDAPIFIYRNSGQAYFSKRPVFNGQTPFDTGNFTPASKVDADPWGGPTEVGFQNGNAAFPYIYTQNQGQAFILKCSATNDFLVGWDGTRITFKVDSTVYSLNKTLISDIRLKNVLGPVSTASSIINELNPVSYEFKKGPLTGTGERKGFIAGNLKDVLPNSVQEMAIEAGSDVKYQHLSDDAAIQLCAILVASQQEMLKRIEELEKRLK